MKKILLILCFFIITINLMAQNASYKRVSADTVKSLNATNKNLFLKDSVYLFNDLQYIIDTNANKLITRNEATGKLYKTYWPQGGSGGSDTGKLSTTGDFGWGRYVLRDNKFSISTNGTLENFPNVQLRGFRYNFYSGPYIGFLGYNGIHYLSGVLTDSIRMSVLIVDTAQTYTTGGINTPNRYWGLRVKKSGTSTAGVFTSIMQSQSRGVEYGLHFTGGKANLYINRENEISRFGMDTVNLSPLFETSIDSGANYTERFSVSKLGVVRINDEYNLPSTDSTAGRVMATNGNGTIYYKELPILYGTGIDSTLCNTTMKFPMGYANNTFTIDTIYVICTGAAVNITPKVYYGTDISATGTAVITSPSAVTSVSTITKISTFDNATITKGNMIWLTFSAITTRPRNVMVQIKGH